MQVKVFLEKDMAETTRNANQLLHIVKVTAIHGPKEEHVPEEINAHSNTIPPNRPKDQADGVEAPLQKAKGRARTKGKTRPDIPQNRLTAVLDAEKVLQANRIGKPASTTYEDNANKIRNVISGTHRSASISKRGLANMDQIAALLMSRTLSHPPKRRTNQIHRKAKSRPQQ